MCTVGCREVVSQVYDLVCDNADVALKRAIYLITEVALQFGGRNCGICAKYKVLARSFISSRMKRIVNVTVNPNAVTNGYTFKNLYLYVYYLLGLIF